MSELIIRKARKDDCTHIMDMIYELAVYEGMEDQVELSEQTLLRDGFESDPPFFHSKIAEINGKAIGYALYYYMYSTNEGGQLLYLEDIYVKEAYRGQGYGKKLFKAIAEEAKKENCKCIQWTVLKWNSKAIDFYKSLGAYDLTLSQNIHMHRFTFAGICQLLA